MKNFSRMSRYAGAREDLVQAGGGNSAFKIEKDKMAIKASGYQLADVTEDIGYAIVNPQIIREAFLQCKDLDNMTEEESKKIVADAFIEGDRPSIETFLHSISGRYSLHTHPVVVNVLACRNDGKKILKSLFKDALIVPYATPGIELAKAYFKAYKAYKQLNNREPAYVFLMNHGLLVSAETAEEVIEMTEKVTRTIEAYLKVDFSAYHATIKIEALFDEGIIWKVTDSNVIEAFHRLGGLWEHYFCPDCVVFLGKKMYEIKGAEIDRKHYESFVSKNGCPIIVLYKNSLYIHAESVKKAMEIQSVLSFSAQVMSMNIGIDCNLLPKSEKDFLLNWDAEKYRKNMK